MRPPRRPSHCPHAGDRLRPVTVVRAWNPGWHTAGMSSPRSLALALPNVEEGVACVGTALESRTFVVAKKAFLFVSAKDARLKLDSSATEAKRLGFAVGANGWVKIELASLPPVPVLKQWIAESHGLMARGRAATKPGAKAPGKKSKKARRNA